MKWYLKCLKQYVDFKGRARRKEFWMFVLFDMMFFLLIILALYLSGNGDSMYLHLLLIYSLATLCPRLAVTIRRLHDVSKSGWFIFVYLIPVIGSIWLLLLLISDSDIENEYGPNPKELEE
jgi:uncharacterized membrane protein YhaH (DUF805 family)